jgi:hypothetical protein
LHETVHAKQTKRSVLEHDVTLADSNDPDDRQLDVDRRLLEEPGWGSRVREHPGASVRARFVRRSLQAAVIDVTPTAFTEQVLLGASSSSGRTTSCPIRARARSCATSFETWPRAARWAT